MTLTPRTRAAGGDRFTHLVAGDEMSERAYASVGIENFAALLV